MMMIEMSLETHPEYYKDYEACLEFLDELCDCECEYPEEVTNFHVYTEVRTDKELECIKSFIATQDLEKTKLIVWSDYCIEDNPRIQPYKEYLDLRVWNGLEEAKGTIIEDEVTKLTSEDDKHYLQSDLLRLLALHKYGGVWIDMDIIFLRDFKCLLDQEYMYQWGSETDFANQGACATVIALKKESEFSYELLKELKVMPIIGGTTIWGKELFASLWRRGYEYTIFPSPFFNTEWLISKKDKELSENVEAGWFANNGYADDNLYLEAFAWHWHNSSKKHLPIEEGSKFELLQRLTNMKLEERGIL
jgi:hypothetical protein|tara:strand:- start:335 stop:1252 length:918 start_codon:yes stop_codon:yes gene_type:complete